MNARKIISGPELLPLQIQEGLGDERRKKSLERELEEFGDKIFFGEDEIKDEYNLIHCYIWNLHVHNDVFEDFKNKFRFELTDNVLKYDNLINLVIMVKNAGEGFRDILTRNLSYVDRWTVLDTGSTDNTVKIVKEVFKNKRGNLYEEPFINFRESRNRALELAGTECFFNIMLDDTYVLNGNIRSFLELARGDDVVDSYSIVIEDTDTRYVSNRITKSSRGLKYINLIHEIIQSENNLNVQIPYENGYIIDVNSEYMKQRTSFRKQQDIEILEKMYIDNPDDPRTLYYLGDSYLGLRDWENAIKYFKERVVHPKIGYKDEIQDSLYYIAVISHFYLNVKWEKCHRLYLDCYNFDQTRSESLYFIAKHYLDEGNKSLGLMYLKKAFENGIPEITMSFRKNIYYYHIPFDLLQYCYGEKEYFLGQKCCERILSNNSEDVLAANWFNIFYHINNSIYNTNKNIFCNNKLICFVSPGGWDNWDGETLITKGIGGSETFTIKYAETMITFGYTVIVFCNCIEKKTYKGVMYKPLKSYISFLNKYKIDVCIINRYQEYIPVTILNNVEKVYYVLHDLVSEKTIIPIDDKLTGIMCISEWHKNHFCNIFPEFRDKTHVISYGIEVSDFPDKKLERYSFIYPSFPNRGLLQLLQIFPKIVERYPEAHLNIFCDIKHSWVQKYYKKEMEQIELLLEQQAKYVTNHGWVNRKTLNEHWSKAHIWLYPCVFHETFCLVSLEAAASKTLVITNGLAALNENTAKGIIVPGNANEEGWQILTLNRLFNVLDNIDKNDYIQENYNWILTKSFNIVVKDFITKYI